MHSQFAELCEGFEFGGRVADDAPAFLQAHGQALTAQHVADVAAAACQLALRFGIDPAPAETGGWLHDISAVLPSSGYIDLMHALGLPVLPAEALYPRILHQRLSAELARDLFNIQDDDLLNAIRHHTTLRAGASPLEMAVFVADKLAWDQPYAQPFLAELNAGLDISLPAGALAYLDYLWSTRESLRCVHPWMVQARDWLHSL